MTSYEQGWKDGTEAMRNAVRSALLGSILTAPIVAAPIDPVAAAPRQLCTMCDQPLEIGVPVLRAAHDAWGNPLYAHRGGCPDVVSEPDDCASYRARTGRLMCSDGRCARCCGIEDAAFRARSEPTPEYPFDPAGPAPAAPQTTSSTPGRIASAIAAGRRARTAFTTPQPDPSPTWRVIRPSAAPADADFIYRGPAGPVEALAPPEYRPGFNPWGATAFDSVPYGAVPVVSTPARATDPSSALALPPPVRVTHRDVDTENTEETAQ